MTIREILVVNTALRHTEFVKTTKEDLTTYFRGTRLFDLYAVDGDKVIRFQSDADWKKLYIQHEKFDGISINSDIALKQEELKIYEKYRIVGGSAVWKGAEVVCTANGDVIVANQSPQGIPWVGCCISDCNDLRYEWIE